MNNSVSVMSPPAPPGKWFAHLAVLVAALLAIGVAAAGAAHVIYSADTLNKDVAAQIRRTTGFATRVDGSTRFYLFPQPRIEIENVSIFDPAGAVRIEAGAFTAYVRLLPLLVGRIEIGHAALYRPDMFVALDRKPMVPQGAVGKFAQSGGSSQDTSAMLLGRIDIVDGRLRIETRPTQATDIDTINMSVDWPSAYASAALSGELTLHGVPLGVEAWLSQPIELLRGGQSATTLRVRSDVLTLSTSGQISVTPRLQYIGPVSADAASLRKLAAIAGYSFPRHGTFGNFDLRGDLDFESDSAALTNLHISLDGNDYEGNLAVEKDNGLPRFSGTLASDLLDITPFLAGTPEPSGSTWNHEAPDLSDLRFVDLDLRISASRLRLYDMEVADAALSLMTKPGLIDLALAEASSNRGTLMGRVSLAAKDKTLEFHVIGSGKDIDISPMDLAFDGRHPLSGSLNASVVLDSTGTDLGHLFQGLAGRAEIVVADGAIKGVDLPATLLQPGHNAGDAPIKPMDGTTAFDRLSFGLELSNGVAKIEQGQVSAPNMQLNFAGSADVRQRTIDLAALGQAISSVSRRVTSTPLSLRVRGKLGSLQLFQGEPGLRLPVAPQQSHDLPDDATSYAPPE